jgi:uncharacterized protein YggE
MPRTLGYFSLLICVGRFTAGAQVASGGQIVPGSSEVPEIATSGRGEIRVAPDMAVFSVSADSRGPTATAAAADNAAKLNRAMAAIRAAGVDSAQISTSGYSVTADYEKNRQIGFIAHNTIRVEVRKIADVGRIIDAALAAGGMQLNSIQFQRVNTQDARRSALTSAVAEARRDAETLAQAAGGSLGKLLYLTSGVSPSPVGRDSYIIEAVATSMTIPQTPIVPGELTVAGVASARWQFIPHK